MPEKRAKACCSSSPSKCGRVSPKSTNCCENTRQQLDLARDRRGELSATAAKLQSDLQHLADTCLNELGIERPILMADTTISAGHRR
jgi:hypothetical protein